MTINLLSVTLGWKFFCLQFKPFCLELLVGYSVPICVFPGECSVPARLVFSFCFPYPLPSSFAVDQGPARAHAIMHSTHIQCISSSGGFLEYNLDLFINVWYFLVLPCVENSTQPVGHIVIRENHHYHTRARQVVLIMLPIYVLQFYYLHPGLGC